MSNDQSDIEFLRSRLDIFDKLYRSDDLEHQRTAVRSALHEVSVFLEKQGVPLELHASILRPALALAERENNNLDQMFAERARTGRPKSSLDDLERTGILAALANFWLGVHKEDGRPQATKLSEAARKMKGPWFGTVTRANLKSAREIVSQESKNHPAVIISKLFDEMLADGVAEAGKVAAFELMIEYINQHPAARMTAIWKTPPFSPISEG